MKVGILTYHSSHNYGAFLQAYALSHKLCEIEGIDAKIIDFKMKKSVVVNKKNILYNKKHCIPILFNIKRYKMFEDCIKKFQLLSQDSLVSDDLEEFSIWLSNQNYDLIIVGSDEVWSLDGYRGFPNPYWLPNVKCGKKIAYAVSSRADESTISEVEKSYIRDFLGAFSYIGVRDQVSYELAKDNYYGQAPIDINCDPTLAYDFGISKQECIDYVKNKYKLDKTKKTIAIMIGVPQLAYMLIKKYNKKYNIISIYNYYEGTIGYEMPNPFEWIKIIGGVDGLITTFYHGMMFAVKLDTPFITIENRTIKELNYSKSYDFLNRYDLEKDHFRRINDKDLESALDKFIDAVDGGDNADFSRIREAERQTFRRFEDYLLLEHR